MVMENNQNNQGKFADRKMTVLHGNKQKYDEKIPCLRLMGKWMQEAGFCPGDKIVIIVNAGKIEIHKDRYA